MLAFSSHRPSRPAARRGRVALCLTTLVALLAGLLAGAVPAGAAGSITASASEQVFSTVKGTSSASQALTLINGDTVAHSVSAVGISGVDAAAFTVAGFSAPVTLAPGGTLVLSTAFSPASTSAGSLSAALGVTTDTGSVTVGLFGLSANGLLGANEPFLADVVTTLGTPVDVGGRTLALSTTAPLLGAEVSAPMFVKAGTAPVTMTPVARYAPNEALPFGWYTPAPTVLKHQLGSLDVGQYQTLNPSFTGAAGFDPATAPFGLYVHSDTFARDTYSEDGRNPGPTAHAVRTYPLHDRSGALVTDGYLVAFEDASNGDYQDYVFRVTGVTPYQPSSPATAVVRTVFGTSSQVPPTGYTLDTGGAYDTTTGQGWVTPGTSTPISMTLNTRLRTAPADVRQRGLVIMQGAGAGTSNPGTGAWEKAVPNGTYTVTVSMGDASYTNSTYSLTAESTSMVSGFVPSTTTPFKVARGTVTVSDGRLTLTATGTNTKINYVDVDSTTAGTPPPADTTPPAVATSLAGTRAADGNFVGSATVTVTASDAGGLASTTYAVDGGPVTSYAGPFAVSTAGAHTVTARAVDQAGNTTDAAPATFTVTVGSGRLATSALDGGSFPDRLVMSRIQNPETGTTPRSDGTCCIPANVVHDTSVLRLTNTGTGTLTVSGLAVTAGFALDTPPALPLSLAAGATADVKVRFVYGGTTRVTVGSLTVTSDDATTPTVVEQLAGLWQLYSEKNTEPTLPMISKTFGYTTAMLYAGQSVNQKGAVKTVGDEVLSPYWAAADTTKTVDVRQLAAYHSQGKSATVYWYAKGSTTRTPLVTSSTVEGQTLLPHKAGSTTSLSKASFTTTSTFGLKVDGEYSDEALNNHAPDLAAGCVEPCGHHMRFWPAYDRSGVLIANTWLMSMDYGGINYDYNDNVYVINNARPTTGEDPSTPGVLPGAAGTALNFVGPVVGTLTDRNGAGTGFTSVQQNKLDTTAGSNSYQASALAVAGGTLTVDTRGTATTGDSRLTDNTLQSGLQRSFDAASEPFTISARLTGPFASIDAGSEQQGISFGPGFDDFVHLAVINSAGVRRVQLLAEVSGAATDVAPSAVLPTGAVTVDLQLVGDPASGQLRAGYRVDGGPLTSAGNYTVPSINKGDFFARRSYAGIAASSKGGASFPASYDSFVIAPDDPTNPDGRVVTRLDAGGTSSYVDTRGRVFGPDAGLFSPSTAPVEGSVTAVIANTNDDRLFGTYRGNVGAVPQAQRILTYAIPCASLTRVRVRLLLAERYAGDNAAGKRVYSVTAEGKVVAPAVDQFAAAGGLDSAVTLTLPDVAVTGGTLDLVLTAAKDYPAVAGIEVFDQSAPADTTPPVAPTGVTARADSTGAVAVGWTANSEPDVSSYSVYRSTGTTVTTADTLVSGPLPVTGTTFTDTSAVTGTTYRYAVLARDTSGNAGPLSAAVSSAPAPASAPTPPSAPTGVSATTGSDGATITVRWTANPEPGISGYQVYRSTTSPVDGSTAPLNGNTLVTGTSFIDTQTSSTTTYHYVVVAVNSVGSSPASAEATATTADFVPPAQPQNVVAVAGNRQVSLSWNANTETDLAGYAIYRSTTSPVPTTGAGLTMTLLTTTSYTDTSVVVGTVYNYVVVAVDRAGNHSPPSSESTAAPNDTVAPAAPTGVAAAVAASGASVTLTWNPSPEPDLAGYAVYRGTSLPVATTGTPLSGVGLLTATSFTDGTVTAGTTYQYVVVARDTAANTSVASSPAAASIPATAAAVSLKVDFTTATGRLVAGYARDYGQPFGARTGADQSSGRTYGWVVDGTIDPLTMTPNARDRTTGTNTTDVRLQSFMHVQFPAENTAVGMVTTPASWELSVPNGDYTVVVGVGDAGPFYDSKHQMGIEGQNAVYQFVPTSTNRDAIVTRTVHVGDGRLTLSPSGGTNTKLAYVDVASLPTTPARPRLTTVAPRDLASGVLTNASVTAELALTAGGVETATVTSANIRLTRITDGVAIPANVNTSGGGDVLVLTPQSPLDQSTGYRFDVTSGVRDVAGNAMQPWSSTFVTGSGTVGTGLGTVNFTHFPTSATGQNFSSIVVGPDHQLYAATLDGFIYRYPIAANGDLGTAQIIDSVRTLNNGASRSIIGLAFAKASTASNLILYVTDNAPYLGVNDVVDWSDKIDRLSGADLQVAETLVIGLPRSNRDHETNSLAFGPDGALYLTQGSTSAMGAPDPAWGNRPEHILSAALLRLDLAKLPGTLPLDVKTEEGGSYDPFAVGAPLTLYATGIRNAYDLVWHSNGHLYAPTNGSAAGGNTPASPATLPSSCANRIDAGTAGPYTGPAVPGLVSNQQAETDYLFNVHQGGYYGHPNPARCEWTLNGGNPTSAVDAWETSSYPAGTLADRNYRDADVFDAGLHASADGALEYRGTAFGGALTGKLLVVRYSAGQDIVVFDPSGAGGKVLSKTIGVTGLTGFNAPLDLAQDTASGSLYVTELGGQRITRLSPTP